MTETLVPVACDNCERVWLRRPGHAACLLCQSTASILPGERYNTSDVALFERVESIVQAAPLPERVWNRLLATLSDVSERSRRPEALLLPVVEELAALQFLQHDPFRERARSRSAVGMLRVLVSARLRFLGRRPTVALADMATLRGRAVTISRD